MLYWGMFTSGFIVGGILASFVFSGSEKDEVPDSSLSNRGKEKNVIARISQRLRTDKPGAGI